MAPEICPGCQQPITPAQWARAVAITASGARAHRACLEEGLLAAYPYYLLARRTTSPALLAPGAAFVGLAGDVAIIGVPRAALDAQVATLARAGAVPPEIAGQVGMDWLFFSLDDARLAATDDPLVRGIWGPDDPLPW